MLKQKPNQKKLNPKQNKVISQIDLQVNLELTKQEAETIHSQGRQKV